MHYIFSTECIGFFGNSVIADWEIRNPVSGLSRVDKVMESYLDGSERKGEEVGKRRGVGKKDKTSFEGTIFCPFN
jgi:hypothetical protein